MAVNTDDEASQYATSIGPLLTPPS